MVGDRKHSPVGKPAGRNVLHLAVVSGEVNHFTRLSFDREQVLVGVLGRSHRAEPAAVWRPTSGDMPRRVRDQEPLLFALRVHHRDVDVRVLPRVGADQNRPAVRRHRVARQVVLHVIAIAHGEVLELTVRTAHVHLPPLGAAPIRCEVQIA